MANTTRALDLCDEGGIKATYFVLGWVARFSALAPEIRDRGHEFACHSFWHRLIFSLTPESFREDLRQAREAIEQADSVKVTGLPRRFTYSPPHGHGT